MPFLKILCPTDFSPGAIHGLRCALRVASEDTEIVLAHVWHVPPLAFAGENPFPPDMVQSLISDEERGLAAAVSEAVALGGKHVSSQFLTGVPWDQIVETLRADRTFDLVAMGTHGRTGLARVLLGSVTEKVVRHAPCSVLVARPHDGLVSFSRVLCPIDFSDSSRHAVDIAAELARPSGAGIMLLHVIELPVTYSGGPAVSELLDGVEKGVAHLLEDWAQDLRSKVAFPVTTEIRIGVPGAQTLSVLHKHPFDLVVLGSHGRTGIRRALLGSVAEKVVRHAACTVLVARQRTT